MNLDTIAGWTIAILCAGLLAWHYASAAWRSLGNLRGCEHAWATIPRDPFYDTLRDQYAEAGRDLPDATRVDWAAFEADLLDGGVV